MDQSIVNGKGRPENSTGKPSEKSQNDVVWEAHPAVNVEPLAGTTSDLDGFDTITFPGSMGNRVDSDLQGALSVLQRVKSIRGHARQEYGKIYKALGPFYVDALATDSLLDCLIFRTYSLPEQQAQIVAQILILAKSDPSPGVDARHRQLAGIVSTFDTAALLEFRQGYEYRDIQGRMKQYARVMYTLNGGQSSVEMFLHDNRLIVQKASLGSATDCIDYSMGYGQVSLERAQLFFDRLANAFTQESAIIDSAFPEPQKVHLVFLEKVSEDVLSPFLRSLFDEAHNRGLSTYLRVLSGSFAQTRRFIQDYATLPTEMGNGQVMTDVLSKIFEPHLDLYLAEELATFRQKAESEVEQWDRTLSEQAASTETFLLSNLNRQADKKDFMSSFKKVVMMPVNILPSFSGSSASKSATRVASNGNTDQLSSNAPSRSVTPAPGAPALAPIRPRSPAPGQQEAPTTELAAKAALMTSKLENIRSLFSIEVALNLVHTAKSSLERTAQFIALGQPYGDAARTQCATMFIFLLQCIGARHIKAGFDKAIEHLATYNPREANISSPSKLNNPQVAPLATFLELVNVGDLIQQMLDVFYESELVRLGISKRGDFLDPSLKEKKRFEAMLDERVAAGLSKGIDVLMDEVEYICATTQLPSDFNPPPESESNLDIGPTVTARKVVEVVQSHTSMLTGATEKTLLDVFTGEVGLRLFQTLTKHLKRQRISTIGALPLLSDLMLYSNFVTTLKNPDLNSYFAALRALAQIYLIDGQAKGAAEEMATIIADGERYKGVFTLEEVIEFAERRSDWLTGGVKVKVEKALYGRECVVM